MRETLRLLQRGREIIASGWCVGYQGQDIHREYQNPWDPSAVRWCALGALNAQTHSYDSADIERACKALAKAMPGGYSGEECLTQKAIADFNDSHSQADVLALYDRAIAKLAPKRTDSELVADLMARVCGERIAEEA